MSGRPAVVLALTVALAGCAPPLAMAAPTARHVPPPLLAPSGPFTLGPDRVTVLRSGEATFTVLRTLIDSARATVAVEVYEFGRADLAAALVRARTRGVAVTMIADPSEIASTVTALALRGAGIDVVDYPVRTRMIDHVKLLVVDDQVAVVGGINWGARSAANHDFDVELRGPAVANLARVFDRDLVTCGRLVDVPPPVADPAVLVGTTLPGAEIVPLVLALVAGARHRLDIAMYTLTDVDVVQAIEDAQARGVAVRVLLDPSERPSDPSAAALRAHGVPVRLYASSGEKLHAKMAVADAGTVLLGSANWTVSGFEHNHELDVSLAADVAVASAFEDQFTSDWSASG